MSNDQVRVCISPVKKGIVSKLDGRTSDGCIPEYTVCEASFDSNDPVKIIGFGRAWRFRDRPEHVQIYPIY
jgi:hypothetical protein